MSTVESRWGTGANAEAIEAWNGPLYERFVRFRHIVTTGLGNHGERALDRLAPAPGERVLDVGCGFGDTTQAIAARVAPGGEAVGVDAAARFIEQARREAADSPARDVSFEVCDVQSGELPGPFDAAYSRFGTMFFANPVAAMRNVRRSLHDDGRLAMVVWRRREDNDWLYRAQTIVERMVGRPTEYDDPTCGPGPFSLSGADTTSDILLGAGFTDIALERCELPICIGRDVEEAVDLVCALGPAGEILRLAGERAAHLQEPVRQALREGLADYAGADGVLAHASTWIVTARAA